MLVLSRNVGERIVINGNIILEILEVRGHKVRLGFDAPKGVEIHREEVYLKIQEEGKKGKKGGVKDD